MNRDKKLFRIVIKRKRTEEFIELIAKAHTLEEATDSLKKTLTGFECEYEWIGSALHWAQREDEENETLHQTNY